jgi:NADPH:quinone reductase-like Zn-dependent oxidoreductase
MTVMSKFSVTAMSTYPAARTTTPAIQIHAHGGIDRLELVDIPAPAPRRGDIVVRTVASTINPVDWKTRAWERGKPFPMTLGWDLAGIVVHSDDPRFAVGDRVIAMSAQIASGIGTWRGLVALPGRLAARAPERVSLAEAATLPLAGLTALQSLAALDLPPGARVLVIGPIGAVGSVFIQLGRRAKLEIEGVVSRDAHLTAARALGLGRVETSLDALPAAAYDAVFDTAGLDPAPVLKPGGAYLSISDVPLPAIPGARGMGVQEDGAALADLAALVDTGELTLRIAHRFALRDIGRAHEVFEAGGLTGKVVLDF